MNVHVLVENEFYVEDVLFSSIRINANKCETNVDLFLPECFHDTFPILFPYILISINMPRRYFNLFI